MTIGRRCDTIGALFEWADGAAAAVLHVRMRPRERRLRASAQRDSIKSLTAFVVHCALRQLTRRRAVCVCAVVWRGVRWRVGIHQWYRAFRWT